MMDGFDGLLTLSQLSATVNINCQLGKPWRLDSPHQDSQAVIHLVVKGQAYLRTPQQTVLLKAGDGVWFLCNQQHSLASSPDANSTPPKALVQEGGFWVNRLGDGEDTQLFCLHFRYDPHARLVGALPKMLIFDATTPKMARVVDLLKQEAQRPDLASHSCVVSLSKVLLILLLRGQAKQALPVHPKLLQLTQAIIAKPEDDWSLAKMANLACLSRAQLTRLFNSELNTSPHAFVKETRLQKAACLLAQSRQSVLAIALACGFCSDTHLGKAFRQMYGVSASAYRKRSQEQTDSQSNP